VPLASGKVKFFLNAVRDYERLAVVTSEHGVGPVGGPVTSEGFFFRVGAEPLTEDGRCFGKVDLIGGEVFFDAVEGIQCLLVILDGLSDFVGGGLVTKAV